MKKYNLDESIFENIDSEEKAYWLGFILADGCIVDRSNEGRKNSKLLTIHLKLSDIEHLKKFKKFLNTDKPIYVGEQKLKGKIFGYCSIHITCSKLAKDLMSHGIEHRKSLKEKLPNIDKRLYPHFLRGYWDGDGSVLFYEQKVNKLRKMYPEICVYSGLIFIKQISQILREDLHIICNPQKNRNIYKLKTSGNKAIPIVQYLYKDANIYLDRKYKTYIEIMNWHNTKEV